MARIGLFCLLMASGCKTPGAETPGSRTTAATPTATSPGPPATGPANGPTDSPAARRAQRIIDHAVAILRNLSRTVNAARGDCQVMGRALDRWWHVNGGHLDGQLRRAMSIPEPTRAALMRRSLGDDPDVSRAMTALARCHHHPSVAAAVARLQMG